LPYHFPTCGYATAQAWIRQFYLQLHHTCLYLVSVHQMALPLTCDGVHLIAAYYSSIDPERMEGWVGLGGRFTYISGHPSAAGRAQHRESLPVRDQRSTAATVPCDQALQGRMTNLMTYCASRTKCVMFSSYYVSSDLWRLVNVLTNWLTN